MFKVLKRSLSRQEAELLVREVKETPNISGYTVKEWTSSRNVFVAEDNQGNVLGACLNVDFSAMWTEIAVLFVFEDYRGMGIGKALFQVSYQDNLTRGRNVLVMSRNKVVVRMMKEFGFDVFPTLKNLNNPYKKYQFTLTVLYEVIWIANLYRICELVRKRLVYASKDSFIYGLKLTS